MKSGVFETFSAEHRLIALAISLASSCRFR